ncbi:MAG: hypothetical protein LBV80_00785 [Deltaproteobacteria bacterium]|jgi:hypothetical protein|nr:hypothetical protein [Deltaproteobacteria bacterium]
MITLTFRLNEQTVSELDSLNAAVVSLAQKLKKLDPQTFRRVKHVFDDFFDVLPRVRDNMIMVDVEKNTEQKILLQ